MTRMTREQLLCLICPSKERKNDCESYQCIDCTLLLIKWLDEYDKYVIEQYKADTNLKDTIREIHDNVANEMYCKGIDELVQKVKEHHYVLHYVLSDVIKSTDYGMFTVNIEQIAEELKAGDNNE